MSENAVRIDVLTQVFAANQHVALPVLGPFEENVAVTVRSKGAP